MPRPSLPRDQNALASIVEAMIFASEEPVPPRTLLRLLYEDPDEKSPKKGPPDASLFKEGAGEGAERNTNFNGVETTEIEVGEDKVSEGESMEVGDELASSEEAFSGIDVDTPTVEPDSPGVAERDESRGSGIGQKELREFIDQLNESYDEEGRSFRIVEIAGGFQFATTKEYAEFVGLLSRDRAKRRLSPAALETLSIIAYRQPVTKPEVEAIRGVNCDQVLVSLLERELITISGRADSVGRPLLYATTNPFLRAFGLNSLSDLPKLRELEELMDDDAVSASRPGDMPPEFALELHDSPDGLEEGTGGSTDETGALESIDGEVTNEANVEIDVESESEADREALVHDPVEQDDMESESKDEEDPEYAEEPLESPDELSEREPEGVSIEVDIPDESGDESIR